MEHLTTSTTDLERPAEANPQWRSPFEACSLPAARCLRWVSTDRTFSKWSLTSCQTRRVTSGWTNTIVNQYSFRALLTSPAILEADHQAQLTKVDTRGETRKIALPNHTETKWSKSLAETWLVGSFHCTPRHPRRSFQGETVQFSFVPWPIRSSREHDGWFSRDPLPVFF